jgi:hypothetical protein
MEKTRDPDVLKWVDTEVDLLGKMLDRNKGFKSKWGDAYNKYTSREYGMATGADLQWDDHYIMEYEAASDDPWAHTKLLRFKKPFDTTFDQKNPSATTEELIDYDWMAPALADVDVDD